MNVKSVEKLEKSQVAVTVEVTAEEFEAAVQKAYLKMRNKISVPGFRPGKAPRKMIEKLYGEGVFYSDAVDAALPDAYTQAIGSSGLDVVGYPEVEIVDDQIGKDGFTFKATVAVYPEVELGQYKGVSAVKEEVKVTADDVKERLNQMAEREARLVSVDRKVKKGDTAVIDFEGFDNGVAFEGGTAEGQTLTLGSNQFIPGFEEQMVGMNIGEEKDLNVTFPEQYHAAELAGKAAVFHVKVNSATHTELPELNDEFAADASEYNTFAEYKDSIVKELNEKAAKNNEVAVENALVEKATANAQMDIPEAMIRDQVNYILREMQMRMAYQGLRLEDYLKYTGQTVEQLADMYKGEAEQRVKMELTLEAIRKAEGVEPTEEDVQKQIAEQAERMGQKVEDFEKTLTDEQRGYLKDSAAIQKVVELLKKDCKVEEKKPETEAAAEDEVPAKKAPAKRRAKKAEAAEESKDAE